MLKQYIHPYGATHFKVFFQRRAWTQRRFPRESTQDALIKFRAATKK